MNRHKIVSAAIGFSAAAMLLVSVASAASYTFTRDLTVGSTGEDVKALQQWLNATGYSVALSGAGSDGNETTYFGVLTRNALSKYQAAKGISPTAGYFGPITRASIFSTVTGKFPAGCTSAVGFSPTTGVLCATTTATYPSGCTSAVGFSPTTGASCSSTVTVTPAPAPAANTVTFAGPASKTLVTTESLATLADFVFTGNVTVTGVALKRLGVSADTTLSNVYLFDGNTRLSDGASVSSGSVINFSNSNGLFTVTGSRTISVKADILTGTGGQQVGIQMTGVTLLSGTMTGLPLSGNIHTIATASLATAAFGTGTATGNADPGTSIRVWESTVTVGTRDVTMTRLALRQIGSIASADINNFKLLADGVEVASSASLDSNGYVTFSGFSKVLLTGARVLKVNADVIGGSGRTVQMSLRGAYDASFTDAQYGANLLATGTFPVGAAAWTVNNGTMTVVKKTDSPSQNVTKGATDASLATYTFTAYGERIKVETLKVGMITTGGTVTDHTIRSVRVLVNGAQVGSTTDVPAAATFATNTGTQFTTNFYVSPGTPATVEIRGDIFDNEGDNNVTTATVFTALQTLLVGGASIDNAIPQVSLGTLDVPSQNNVLGNNLTIASGTITLSKQSNYGDQTIVAPQTAYKLGAFNLAGNSTEAVNINNFMVEFTSVTNATFSAADLTDVYLVYNGVTSTVKGTVTATSNSWSQSLALAKNQTVPVLVYATVGPASAITALDSIKTEMVVTGVTAGSALTVYADDGTGTGATGTGFDGQTIIVNTGSITATVDASRPNATLLDDSGTVTTAAYKFAAVNDSYTITDVTVTLATATAVQNVMLMDGATTLATKAAGATVTFSGLNVAVSANTSKILTVNLQMGTVGVGAGGTGASVLTTLTSHTTRNSGGTIATTAVSLAGQPTYAYAAIPTITNVALPSSTLVGGGATHTLARFTVGTNGTGTIGWGKFIFTVNKNITGTDAVTSPTMWDVTSGASQISGSAIVTTLGDGQAAGTITFLPNTEQQVSGAKTYELRATVTGAPVSGDSLTTQIAQPSAFATSVQPFGVHTASGVPYYDVDNGQTVSAGDIRQAAQVSVTSAYVQTATGIVTFDAGTTDASDEVKSYGTVTDGQTIILTETGAATNEIGAITGTLVSTGGFTCTARDTAEGVGAATTTVASIESILCTNATTSSQVVLDTLPIAAGGSIQITTITLTTTSYAVGSTVAAADSDLPLVVTTGVLLPASFVWSDLSAVSHSFITTDWTNGYLVKNLATDTQNLLK